MIELIHMKYLEHCLEHMVSSINIPFLLLLEFLENCYKTEVVMINVDELSFVIINFCTKHEENLVS